MRRRRSAFLATLLLLGGCGGMKSYTMPGDIEPQPESEIRLVKKGMNAVVTLTSGEVVKGEVLEVTPDRIVLGKHSNYGYQEKVYLAEDIAKITSEKPPTPGQVILGTVAFFGALFVIAGIAFMLYPPQFG